MKIFGKALKEHIYPIKYYILVSILVVISQYVIALPLSNQYPFILNLTQAVWALMVALSVVKLVKDYHFGMKNVIVVGVFFCFIIHGLKVSIRYIFYEKSISYVIDRFLYGSFLVMTVAIVIGIVFYYAKKKKLLT